MAYPYQTGYNQVMPPVYGGYGQQPLQPQGPMCRMVSSREEASSTPVDFSGSLMVFADIQNNRIYTKRWDAAAGAARFGEYIPAPPPQPAQNGKQKCRLLFAIDQTINRTGKPIDQNCAL